MRVTFNPADAGIVPSPVSQSATYNGKLRSTSLAINGETVDPDGKSGWATLALTLAQRAAFDALFGTPEGLAALMSGEVDLPDSNSGRKAVTPTESVAARVARLAAEAEASAAAIHAGSAAEGPHPADVKRARMARKADRNGGVLPE